MQQNAGKARLFKRNLIERKLYETNKMDGPLGCDGVEPALAYRLFGRRRI